MKFLGHSISGGRIVEFTDMEYRAITSVLDCMGGLDLDGIPVSNSSVIYNALMATRAIAESRDKINRIRWYTDRLEELLSGKEIDGLPE